MADVENIDPIAPRAIEDVVWVAYQRRHTNISPFRKAPGAFRRLGDARDYVLYPRLDRACDARIGQCGVVAGNLVKIGEGASENTIVMPGGIWRTPP